MKEDGNIYSGSNSNGRNVTTMSERQQIRYLMEQTGKNTNYDFDVDIHSKSKLPTKNPNIDLEIFREQIVNYCIL